MPREWLGRASAYRTPRPQPAGWPLNEMAGSVAAVVRSIELADVAVAARVVEIQQAAYRVEAQMIGFDRIPPLLETIDDVRSQPLSWLGSFEEHPLAGIIGWTVANGVCDIDRLAVHPTFARRGHGRRLVSHLLQHDTIIVSTGTNNVPARHLYESLGFIRTGEHEIADGVTVAAYERRT